jgi:hypothetical protein
MASYASDLNPFMGMKMMHKFLHPEEAYESAQKAAQRGWDETKGFETPFMQHGLDQYGGLNEAEQKLMHPEQLQNEWAQGYETSPYAQRMLAMNSQQGQEAASSMGLGGSSAAVGNIQQGAGDIVARDRQQYLDDMMKKYMSGIGIGQSLYGTGATMGGKLGDQSMTQGQNMASLKYGADASQGKLFENLLRTAGKLYMGGGANSFNSGEAAATT